MANVFVWCRRHGQPRVVGEQVNDTIDVVGGERVGEAAGKLPLACGIAPARGASHRAGADSGRRRAGTLQDTLYRSRAGAQHFGYLYGREVEHVVQQQRGHLTRRQPLQGDDER